MVTDTERREVARRLRSLRMTAPGVTSVGHGYLWSLLWAVFGDELEELDRSDWFERMCSRLVDLIEPGPRAEEIAARAYRAAADHIDWELGDTPRVMALRERADELERMAHERDAAMENHEPTPKCSEPTPKCDREALLALADGLEGHARDVSVGRNFVGSRDLNDYARRIREALGATDGN